jgi:hypothetical protein
MTSRATAKPSFSRRYTFEQIENFRQESTGKQLCVLLDDGTRDEPFDDIFAQQSKVAKVS